MKTDRCSDDIEDVKSYLQKFVEKMASIADSIAT